MYVPTEDSSLPLIAIVTYIIKVYAPMWFAIKCNSSCKDGPKHVLQTILKSRYLTDDLKAIVDPVIARNAYFSNPENILLSMITDDRKYIRELGLRRKLKARSQKYGIRQFVIPKLNFGANDYIDLIDWQNVNISEPPLLADISENEIKDLVVSRVTSVIDFPKYGKLIRFRGKLCLGFDEQLEIAHQFVVKKRASVRSHCRTLIHNLNITHENDIR